jgi:hypothetical protein
MTTCRAAENSRSGSTAGKSKPVQAERPKAAASGKKSGAESPSGESPREEKTPQHVEQEFSPAETAGRIIRGMRAAEDRITHKDTGSETRDVQQRVVEDLQSLIDAANQMKSRQQSASRSQNRQQSSSKSQPEKDQGARQDDSGQGTSDRRPDDSGIDPSEAMGKTVAKDAEAASRRKLIGEVWGHLPESLRQKLRNDLGEKTLPGYDDLVRQYFEALAEQWKPPSKSSEKKIQ